MTREELEQLIHKHGSEVYGFCYYLTGNREEADDLYQDTFLKAYEIRHRMQYDGSEELLYKDRNYCMGIATRLYKNKCRKKVKHPTVSIDEEEHVWEPGVDDNTPDKLTEEKMLKGQIRGAVEELPLKMKAVVYLHYYVGLSEAETAKALRIPQGTVKSRLHEAKKKLREKLEE